MDRIGQQAEKILCYSFLPADGVERIIRLRARVRQRLKENAEVVGTDEAFFEDDTDDKPLLDLYHEKAGILDGDADTEVDLASYAYQIWKNAIDRRPALQKTIPELPNVVYSTKPHTADRSRPRGRPGLPPHRRGNDALAWVDERARASPSRSSPSSGPPHCAPDTPALPRHDEPPRAGRKGVELIVDEEKTVGGQLGRPSGARFRTYERLKRYADAVKGTLFDTPELRQRHRGDLPLPAAPVRHRHAQPPAHAAASPIRAWPSSSSPCATRAACASSTRTSKTQEPQIICSLGPRQLRPRS